jgi:hypothetical protein
MSEEKLMSALFGGVECCKNGSNYECAFYKRVVNPTEVRRSRELLLAQGSEIAIQNWLVTLLRSRLEKTLDREGKNSKKVRYFIPETDKRVCFNGFLRLFGGRCPGYAGQRGLDSTVLSRCVALAKNPDALFVANVHPYLKIERGAKERLVADFLEHLRYDSAFGSLVDFS